MKKENNNASSFKFEAFKAIAQSSEKSLLKYITSQLPSLYGKENVIATNDYVFAKGEVPVMLVSHLDTVHRSLPSQVFYDRDEGVIWSPQGIGGDDRCGVYSILSIICDKAKNKQKLPSVIFTTQEEVGCVGAKKAAKELVDKVKGINFLIELDRKGYDDAVFYSCDNPEFEKFVLGYGFKKQIGSVSDISQLSPAWGMASVNFSTGVYNCHTTSEIIYVDEMMETIDKVIKILDTKDLKFYEYKEKKLYTSPKTTTPTTYNYEQESIFSNYGYYEGGDEFDSYDDYLYGNKKSKKKTVVAHNSDSDMVDASLITCDTPYETKNPFFYHTQLN